MQYSVHTFVQLTMCCIHCSTEDINDVIGFTIRVWVTYEDEEEEEEEGGKESCLTFERKVELFDLSYLGLMARVYT